jgi:hypothetical protein
MKEAAIIQKQSGNPFQMEGKRSGLIPAANNFTYYYPAYNSLIESYPIPIFGSNASDRI